MTDYKRNLKLGKIKTFTLKKKKVYNIITKYTNVTQTRLQV